MRLEYVPPPLELERAFAARFIMTMASSLPDKQVIKMFLYAQHVSSCGGGVCVCLQECVNIICFVFT